MTLDEPDDGRRVATTEKLTEVLTEARRLGFLGPGPVADHLAHAGGFVEALGEPLSSGAGERLWIADLGSGGGLPGLPLLLALPDVEMVLLDASQKRCSFLVWATVELGVAARARVSCARAERFGHEAAHREGFDVVVARGFGSPAWTVECGAPLLRRGGRLLISEPPGGRSWPAAGLAAAGLREVGTVGGVAVFERSGEVRAELARSAKEHHRRPLFTCA